VSRFIKAILSSFSAAAFILIPQLNAGSKSGQQTFQSVIVINDSVGTSPFDAEMELIYVSLGLEKKGLNKEAFKYAYAGYKKLEEEGRLNKEGLITICDFSQSSKRKTKFNSFSY